MIYEEVFLKFNQRRVRYVVVGGIATVLHGAVRFTADLDIVVEMTASNIKKVFSALQELGYRPRVPVKIEDFQNKKIRQDWIRNKSMRAFSFFHTQDSLKIVDLLIEEFLPYSQIKKIPFRTKGVMIPAASIGDLVKFKKIAGRPQDILDIESLQEVKRLTGKKNEKKKTR